MKKNSLLMIIVFAGLFQSYGQTTDDYSAIKLFIDPSTLENSNKDLTENLRKRLYLKVIQLINQTGVAEIGYSTFLVTPIFDVLTTSVDQAGISKVWLAECELNLSISRIQYGTGNVGAASYASFVKKIMGSGSTKDDAISNGINSISSSDNQLVNFLKESKVKIDNYFKLHCDDVLKEADQAAKLKKYDRAIALYFSIPSSAIKCYDKARSTSIGVYTKFIEDDCEIKLIKLKAIVALAMTKDTALSASHYNEALDIIKDLNPASPKCYAEAKMQIEKIEKRFDESQKHDWDLETKRASDAAELQKEAIKAMGKINSNYQPEGQTIIISK